MREVEARTYAVKMMSADIEQAARGANRAIAVVYAGNDGGAGQADLGWPPLSPPPGLIFHVGPNSLVQGALRRLPRAVAKLTTANF